MITGQLPFPQRKPNRLLDFDYSQPGLYFVTICTEDRKELLSKITLSSRSEPTIDLSRIGREVEQSIHYINHNLRGIRIEYYVIMPNHVHLLILIESEDNKISLTNVVGRLKSYTTKRFNQINRSKNIILWQRSFYDHVIRDQDDCANILNYIDLNPFIWVEEVDHAKD